MTMVKAASNGFVRVDLVVGTALLYSCTSSYKGCFYVQYPETSFFPVPLLSSSMTSLAEDEKRIFEALERELNDELKEDSYPDPDETLSFDHWDPENTTSAWKIKVRDSNHLHLILLLKQTDECICIGLLDP
jgi:hypothetical protein